jgi:hypothetical protein
VLNFTAVMRTFLIDGRADADFERQRFPDDHLMSAGFW